MSDGDNERGSAEPSFHQSEPSSMLYLRPFITLVCLLLLSLLIAVFTRADAAEFQLDEATIAQVQQAYLKKELTSEQLVRSYLARIKAYNGTCVSQPQGLLGAVTTIPNAGQINALQTLNLRPKTRKALGFDERKARSMTDAADNDSNMPDALEIAAALDREFASTGKLVGPLHGIPISIKDQYDTFDMRTTSGADAPYANDRPPADSTFVKRLRDAGAIIIAKANMGEYASGDRSAFGGTFCNPYDTERSPGRSSGGSGSSVAANLVMCSVGEESGPSVRNPAKNNNIIGLAPTQELVSRAGMIRASYMNDRVGPMCRTVEDTARVLDVIAGYDPKDELTAFSVGRRSTQPYYT
jgi:amidase